MEIKKEKAVSFTGYRTEKILRTCKAPSPLNYVLIETIKVVEQLYNEGYTTFLSGMAKGFDLIAAEAVLIVKEQHSDIRLIAIIPYEGQELGYKEADKYQYNRVYKSADEVVFTAKRYHEKAYFDRNDYLLANCSKIVCYYTGLVGGTMYTVNRAKKANIPIVNIAAPTELKLF